MTRRKHKKPLDFPSDPCDIIIMTQKQIDSRLSDLQPFLARAKASGDTALEDRVLKEIHFLEDMWMELEMEDDGEEDVHYEFEPPY